VIAARGATATRSPLIVWLALAGLAAGAALLRAWHMVEWPLHVDEAITWATSHADLFRLVTWRAHRDHPPLSFLVVRWTTGLLQTDAEWALRLPSVLLGIMCVPAAFLLGRRLFGLQTAGLALAALVAVDPALVEQARRARMYSQLVFLTIVALIVLDVLLERRETRRAPWIGLAAILATACWTHFLAYLLLPSVLAGAWSADREAGEPGRTLRPAALCVGLAGLASCLGVARFALSLEHTWNQVAVVAPGATAEALRAALHAVPLAFLGPALVAAGLVGLAVSRARRGTRVALGVLAGLTLVAALAAAGGRPFAVERFLLPFRLAIHVGLVGLAARSTSRAARAGGTAAIAVLALALVPPSIVPDLPRNRWAGAAARAMGARAGPTDRAIYFPPFFDRLGGYYGVPGTPRRSLTDGGRTWLFLDDFSVPIYLDDRRVPFDEGLARALDAFEATGPAGASRVDRDAVYLELIRSHAVALRHVAGGVEIVTPADDPGPGKARP